jgi:hypothetical protein
MTDRAGSDVLEYLWIGPSIFAALKYPDLGDSPQADRTTYKLDLRGLHDRVPFSVKMADLKVLSDLIRSSAPTGWLAYSFARAPLISRPLTTKWTCPSIGFFSGFTTM